ncbi:MAG: biotin transporter BioY [Synechococcales cyanobacterium]
MRVLVPTPLDLIWAAIGVILTALGTLCQITFPPHLPLVGGYTFSLQLGGVFLTACLGGSLAGLYAQAGYLALGLSGVPIFSYGGGWEYSQQPAFGYLVGFLPAAWICGRLAHPPRPKRRRRRMHQQPRTRSRLGWACILGLAVVHLCGMGGIIATKGLSPISLDFLWRYSLYPLPGHGLVVVTVISLTLIYRRITFSTPTSQA